MGARHPVFWSSDKLTGSQPGGPPRRRVGGFWSSDKLTGSQPRLGDSGGAASFGAVTN